MAISVYTSRVTLEALGVDNYGIYNVVGGFVALFAIVSGSLTAGISRFITFELGRGNNSNIEKVFATTLVVQLSLSTILLIVAESLGLWFLNFHMNIPADRMVAANWVYQCSIITFVVSLISVPYNAAIIAHEKMSAFAYITIAEVSLKLIIAYLLFISEGERLILYAVLMLMNSLIIRMLYTVYCKRHFGECNVRPHYHKEIFKQIASFSGWNFIGATAGVLREQGVNILLNLFFGPAVNAARGITTQINTAVSGFCNNFMVAINPQLTKSFAANEFSECFALAFRSAKFAFFIMFLPSLPIILNTSMILSIWLKVVPPNTAIFVQLSLLYILIEVVSYPLVTIMLATGNIRNYQLIVGGFSMMNFPLAYLALHFGLPPASVYIVSMFCAICCFISRLIMLRKMVTLPVRRFIVKVIIPCLLVFTVSFLICVPINYLLPDNIGGMIYSIVICLIITSLSIMFLGCSINERKVILSKVAEIKDKFIRS